MSDQNPAIRQALSEIQKIEPDQFEIYFQRQSSIEIQAKDQKVDGVSKSEDVGLAIRLLKEGRLGFSFTTSLETGPIAKAVQTAAAIAQLSPKDSYASLQSFQTEGYPKLNTWDAQGLEVPMEEKTALAKRLESACMAADSRIKGIRSAEFGQTSTEVQMLDSQENWLQHQSTIFSTSITCKAEANGSSEIGDDFDFSHRYADLEVETVAKRAAEAATELLGAEEAETMSCPAVFRNQVMTQLLEFLASSFSAEEVDKGRSMLAKKLGEVVFSPAVSIVDDGLRTGGYSLWPFDGEGAPRQRTPLIESGKLATFLTDGYYSRKLDLPHTSNASRGIKGPPGIGVTNLYLKEGSLPLENLCQKVSRGVLITDLMGVHTANPVTGDFSLGASGRMIENGTLGRPIRGFAVAGNILEVFKSVEELGSDLRFFGRVGAPSALISKVSIGGK